ncbi:hypothetical protein YYC_01825 [Plasmodium yoelii 17X]|uniref:Uncharacterized protein n=2 Tax=Plasmodium yoelii TaxID=5861 RepID=Q7RI01_PLAYO|nr:hypothetical protein [Plasmodium yoelii yoelii]ETB62102.1 hypothetical protein YYC_01825 [Plasmodium yoelii 17X]
MNTKLYSLFFFIYLIIVYCATVQGNKNSNGKADGHGLSFIKKVYQNSNNKDKHMLRTDEDGIGTFNIKYLYKCVYYTYIQIIQNCSSYFILLHEIVLCIINNFCFINPSGDVVIDILKKEYVDPHIIKLVDIVNKKEIINFFNVLKNRPYVTTDNFIEKTKHKNILIKMDDAYLVDNFFLFILLYFYNILIHLFIFVPFL